MAGKTRAGRKEEIARAIVEEFGARTADEAQEALRQILGPAIEAMLRAELDAHLGYASNDKSPKQTANRRNGYTPKRVRTSAGEVEISVPRDRDGSFEPVAVPKGCSDLSGIESRVISMYARGMSQRDIAATVREIYGFSMSAETVSAITDRVWEDLERWRSRPLEPAHAFMFVDCLHVPVRGARNAAVYAVLAYDLRGRKDILGLWMDDSEGAHRWMQAFDELRARGVEDILYVSSDGVAGLGEGLASVFPRAVHQRCVVHLVRNSLRCVPQKEAAAFCRSARAVYGAPSLAAAESAWEAFRGGVVALPGRRRRVGAQPGPGVAALLLRLGGQARHVHDQRPRVGQRQLPQGREAGVVPQRGGGDEAVVPEGAGAVPQVGRGLPPRGVVAGPKPAALRRVDQAEDRALPIGSRSGDLHRLLDMPTNRGTG